jgi:hypothetical protein
MTEVQGHTIRRLGRHRVSLFEIQNQAGLEVVFRLLRIVGLPRGEHYDKNLNRLLRDVQYEMKEPVAQLERQGEPYLAVLASAPLPTLERRLMPHYVELKAESEERPLRFGSLAPDDHRIATSFLQWAVQGALFRDRRLWRQGRGYFSKHPLSAPTERAVDVYPGFTWTVVTLEDGRLMLAVDVSSRFVDHGWLIERLNNDGEASLRGRNCLYQFGHQWYVIQFRALLTDSISDYRFLPEPGMPPIDLYTYIRQRWGAAAIAEVRDLDPTSPAILFRTGNESEKSAAAALCKLVLPTSDPMVSRLQRDAILSPTVRFERITEVVRKHFGQVRMGSQGVDISTEPLSVTTGSFSVPAQRFGSGRVLAVDSPASNGSTTDRRPLTGFARRRLEMALDPAIGPLESSPLGPQYLVQPQSLAREINDDFAARVTRAMVRISGQQYAPRRILYDDRGVRGLYRQVQAITTKLKENNATAGYALVVLPERPHPDVHNYLKKSLWPDVQLQCALANKIQGQYFSDSGIWRPKTEGKLESYVRNCALGLMVVNRKWLWALEDPLWYDVYIGIDVLHQMAGVTFVFQGGRRIQFGNHPVKHKEKLTTRQVRNIVKDGVKAGVRELGLRVRSLVVHRDGRCFDSEIEGIHAAIDDLKLDAVLPADVTVGIVEIRKTTHDSVRLVAAGADGALRNPLVGTYLGLAAKEGVVCTTGEPFAIPGTSRPLAVGIVDGPVELEKVMEDVFALSQLVFTAPDKCERLPITIKLADDFLEPIAGDADDEEGRYDGEEDAVEAEDQGVLAG